MTCEKALLKLIFHFFCYKNIVGGMKEERAEVHYLTWVLIQDATAKLPADKQVTRKDAEGVAAAEMRNDPMLTTHPAGVAASVAAAARLNQSNKN